MPALINAAQFICTPQRERNSANSHVIRETSACPSSLGKNARRDSFCQLKRLSVFRTGELQEPQEPNQWQFDEKVRVRCSKLIHRTSMQEVETIRRRRTTRLGEVERGEEGERTDGRMWRWMMTGDRKCGGEERDGGEDCNGAEVEMSASMAKSTTCRYELSPSRLPVSRRQ